MVYCLPALCRKVASARHLRGRECGAVASRVHVHQPVHATFLLALATNGTGNHWHSTGSGTVVATALPSLLFSPLHSFTRHYCAIYHASRRRRHRCRTHCMWPPVPCRSIRVPWIHGASVTVFAGTARGGPTNLLVWTPGATPAGPCQAPLTLTGLPVGFKLAALRQGYLRWQLRLGATGTQALFEDAGSTLHRGCAAIEPRAVGPSRGQPEIHFAAGVIIAIIMLRGLGCGPLRVRISASLRLAASRRRLAAAQQRLAMLDQGTGPLA